MADIMSILSSNYPTVGQKVNLNTGKYVNGFRAKAKYQYGSTVKYQDVLIKNNAFRVGDSKFTLTKAGTAQVKTVMTDPATGASSLETAYVYQT